MLEQLQRNWYVLSGRSVLNAAIAVGGLILLYAVLRRACTAEQSVAVVLLVTSLLPLLALAALSTWAVLRTAA